MLTDEGVRALAAAVCLSACIDYKKAINGKLKKSAEIIQECEEFFDSNIFHVIVPNVEREDILVRLKTVDESKLHRAWHKIDGYIPTEE